jgi:RNA-directed DNA polymerase
VDVSEKQRRLSQKAEQEQAWRFFALYSLLYNPDWLWAAHAYVQRNAGSKTPGCDGITMADFDAQLEKNLATLAQTLKVGTFIPSPVRRTYIHEQKADGRIKVRPLGIPAIADRIVQEALRMMLEPIFEPDFSRNSYGFRPNRCTQDAVNYIALRLRGTRAYSWVVEGDIEACFDSFCPRKLMRCLRRRIRDRRVLALIWHFLRAGILEEGQLRHSGRGVPQGGILSPLLANVYLHELDRYMARYTDISRAERLKRRRHGHPNFLYVRYCDDFVVLCEGDKAAASTMREELQSFLHDKLRLTLSLPKTKVTHVKDGFEFLGFQIEKSIGQSGKCVPKVRIPRRAMQRIEHKLQTALAPSTCQDSVNTKLLGLNRIIGGWCRYYQQTSSPSYYFTKLEHKVFWWMAHWLGRKYRGSIPKLMRRFRQGGSFGTNRRHLQMPTTYKTQRSSPKTFANPYTNPRALRREASENPEQSWSGHEARKGQADLREWIYERDQGRCGRCGTIVPWQQAVLDHRIPYARFRSASDANAERNLWILHRAPCHRLKTKRDLHVLSRIP